MSPLFLRRLSLAFALLAALWAFLLWRERRPSPPAPLSPEAASASRLVLGGPGKSELALEKGQGGWELSSPFRFPADQAAVSGLLEKLARLRLSEPLSSRPERHELFAVHASSAIRLRLYRLATDSEPFLDAWIGRPGAEYDTFFLRRERAPEVYEARGMGRFELEKEPGEWADRVACALPPAEVSGLELLGQKEAARLTRSAGRWLREGGVAVSSAGAARVEQLLAALSRFEADSVSAEASLDPLLLRGVDRPELRLKASYGVSKTLVLDIGPKAPEFVRWVRRKGKEGFLYRFSGWKLGSLLLTPKELR